MIRLVIWFSEWRAARKYQRAWDLAIKGCLRSYFTDAVLPRRFAILAIRRFECVNRGVPFNPLDRCHVDRIAGGARYEALFEALRAVPAYG